MDRFTYDTLKYLKDGGSLENLLTIFHIEMNCDHKYSNGESAIKKNLWVKNCEICDRIVS